MANEADTVKQHVKAVCDWFSLFANDRTRQLASPSFVGDLETYIGEARMIRWSMIAGDTQVAELWEKVMPGSVGSLEESDDEEEVVQPMAKINQDIVDFVMNGTAYMLAVTATPSQFFENMVRHVASSITWPMKARLLNEEVKDRAATYDFIYDCLANNSWILFLYMVSIAPIDATTVRLHSGPTLPDGDSKQ